MELVERDAKESRRVRRLMGEPRVIDTGEPGPLAVVVLAIASARLSPPEGTTTGDDFKQRRAVLVYTAVVCSDHDRLRVRLRHEGDF